MRRWYQTIEIDGVNIRHEDGNRKNSKFWNEGKWDNYIEPLLPKERGTFIEIGCNAGLFLKKAKDAGFRDVIGIEAKDHAYEQALVFKKHNKYDYKLIQQQVGKDFVLDDLPVADVVLLSNAHYYFKYMDMIKLVDGLRHKTLCCIVVGARARMTGGYARHYIDHVRSYFHGWNETKVIDGIEVAGDPAPREYMYSVLFKSELEPYYFKETGSDIKIEGRNGEISDAVREYCRKVISGESFDKKDTMLYRWYSKNRTYWPKEKMLVHLEDKADLIRDVVVNGIKEPIFYKRNMEKLYDGLHRMILAQELGHKHIIYRKL